MIIYGWLWIVFSLSFMLVEITVRKSGWKAFYHDPTCTQIPHFAVRMRDFPLICWQPLFSKLPKQKRELHKQGINMRDKPCFWENGGSFEHRWRMKPVAVHACDGFMPRVRSANGTRAADLYDACGRNGGRSHRPFRAEKGGWECYLECMDFATAL